MLTRHQNRGIHFPVTYQALGTSLLGFRDMPKLVSALGTRDQSNLGLAREMTLEHVA
jgi:hypothetical protein